MNLKYKVILTISVLLLGLSLITSVVNYLKSLEQTRSQLIDVSLPLSITNTYTEVQKNIIEPNLISSMMANDTFLKDWLLKEESNSEKIQNYLSTIKNKYNLLNTFLVSDITKKYYTSDGFIETLNNEDKWYFDLKDARKKKELNLDFNSYIDDSIVMFINYKIFDETSSFIGVTGVAIKTSYIDNMLKNFRKNYNFNVYFINHNGDIVLSEKNILKFKNINEIEALKKSREEIYKSRKKIEYIKDGEKHILTSKYIKELDLYLLVEAKVNTFTKNVKKAFYINLISSLLITLLVIYIILNVIKKYNRKLEYLASYDELTNIPNRRKFTENFENSLLLFKRDNIEESIIFFDIDDFKKLNDIYGHLVGDKVLKRIGLILNRDIRKTDYIARWGGEEFAILCNNIDLEQAQKVAEKLRLSIEKDSFISELIGETVSASFGVTQFIENDDYDTIVTRVDEALYEAKRLGKNQVVLKG
jgi:diguanylate cyclase (GGDEF)-like protein